MDSSRLIEIRAIEFLTKKLISVNNLVKIEGKALTNPVAVPRWAGKGLAVRWPVRGSVPVSVTAIHLARPLPERVEQPTRTAAQDRACRAGRHVSLHGLAPMGFTMPGPLPARRCALTAPFHPYHPKVAVCFLWHFPWGRPRRALPGILILWSPDFPLPEPRGSGSSHPAI